MTKVHKATSQEGFLLRRKLTVEGLSESQWDNLIEELNHNPCVDFAERKPNDNVRANAEHDPFCCSKIPPMKRK